MEKAGPYEQAILLLDDDSLDGADEKRKRARALLEEAVALRPAHAFIRARNFFRSRLADEAERIRNRKEPGRARRQAVAEREQCAEFQRELAAGFDAARVPEALRPLADWAVRYGIGDDGCRPYLMKRLTKKQKAALIRAMDEKSELVQRWLDSFAPGSMSSEAAAFMYLAEGVEEIRTS